MNQAVVVAKPPEAYPRRILLCVTGMTPPVVTETLYALLRQSPPFRPTAIYLVTTAKGRQRAQEELLDTPRIRDLLRDYSDASAPIEFSADTIYVPAGRDGRPLEDLRTEDDNACMADSILETVADLSEDAECAIHASIAGGRKTMSYYLGQVMSLLGRPQDCVSHVLVNAPFENAPNFFYPPKVSVSLDTREGPINTAEALVDLAFIPFVRLQARLSKKWLQNLRRESSLFTQAVTAAQLGIERPRLFIDLHERRVYIGRTNIFPVTIPASALCFYAVAAARRRRTADAAAAAIRPDDLPLNALDLIRDYAGAKQYRQDGSEKGDTVAQMLARRDPEAERGYYDRCNHRIRYSLIEAAGPDAPAIYGLVPLMRNAYGLFGLKPEDIDIRWPVGNELAIDEMPWD